MENILYIILWVYFAFGALLILKINKKKSNEQRKQAWLKYFTYLLIVNLLFGVIFINPSYFKYVSIAIIGIGFYEIISIIFQTKKYKTGFVSLFIFAAFSYVFFQFSFLIQSYLFYTLFMVTVFDAMSQMSGQLLGKRKILPHISPSKTLEGLLGGLLFSIITSFLIRDLLNISFLQSLTLGLAISGFAFLGDVLASYAKRKFQIKDFSQLIPGHGGFLDRFDSFIAAGAFMYFFTKYFGL